MEAMAVKNLLRFSAVLRFDTYRLFFLLVQQLGNFLYFVYAGITFLFIRFFIKYGGKNI